MIANRTLRCAVGWAWIAGIALGLVWTGCQQQDEVGQTQEGELVLGRTEVTEQVRRAVALGNRALVLDGFRGAVHLRGTDDETAQLTFTKHARGQDDAAARKLMGRIGIRESGNDEQYTYTMRSPTPNRSAVNVTGTVPRTTQLQVQLQSGAVALSDVWGPIEVNHESGPVQIGGAATSVTVEGRNGNVKVGWRKLPSDAQVRLETANGNIELALPETTSVRVNAETSAGRIRTSGLDFEQRRLEPKGAGARFEAQLGAGNASIETRTQNGDIVLRTGRIRPQLPADTTVAPLPDSVTRSPTDTAAAPADTSAPAFPAPDTMDDTTDTTGAEDA